MSLGIDLKEEDLEDDEFVVLIIKNDFDTANTEPSHYVESNVDESEPTNIDNQEINTEDSDYEINDQEQFDTEYLNHHEESLDLAEDHEEHTDQPKTSNDIHHNYSYIEELRNKYSELQNDESQLVAKVVEIMRNCKPEDPPDDYVISGTLKCSSCFVSSQNIGFARRHYQNYHGPRYLICYACGSSFRSTSALYRHENNCKADDKHIVLKARAICIGERGRNIPKLPPGFNKKKKPYKPKHTFDCTECSARFKSKVALTTHKNLHLGVRPYQCDVCAAAYTSQLGLRRHMKKHNPENYICDNCGRVYHIKQSLVEHMAVHLPEKKYVCKYRGCNVSSTYKRTMKTHVDTVHLKLPKPFPCKFCNKRFGRAVTLKIHMNTKHGLDLMTRKQFFLMLPTMSDPQAITANAALLREEQVLVVGPDSDIAEFNHNLSS